MRPLIPLIPKDKELLSRMYWEYEMTLTEMADAFGAMSHKSVLGAMKRLGIPTRSKGEKRRIKTCRDCGVNPPVILKHKLTKNGTGTRCAECLRKYKNEWAKKALGIPEKREKRQFQHDRWYHIGALNPKDEQMWITKGKHLLRSTKRILAATGNAPIAGGQFIATLEFQAQDADGAFSKEPQKI